jgi:hypothetical protein
MANAETRPTPIRPAARATGSIVASGGSRAAALALALEDLADASDTLTIAVERHDLPSLLNASDRAERLTEQVAVLATDLSPADRLALDGPRIAGLRERLGVSARRNAYLIERAWALDAATMRLLASVGQGGSDGSAGDRPKNGYLPQPVAAMYLDREA